MRAKREQKLLSNQILEKVKNMLNMHQSSLG